jgi:hypothetical protein
MVLSWQRKLMPNQNKQQEMCTMDRWIALGIFLLGAGGGALTTVALFAGQIRRLRDLPETASHGNSQTVSRDHSAIEEQSDKSDGRKSH